MRSGFYSRTVFPPLERISYRSIFIHNDDVPAPQSKICLLIIYQLDIKKRKSDNAWVGN